MHKKKRKMQIGQKQLRKRKNVSFKGLSHMERGRVASQEKEANNRSWGRIKEPLDANSLDAIEAFHKTKFKAVLGKLRSIFEGVTLEVLDEAAGRSSLKHELMQPEFGGNLNVTTTDLRRGNGWPNKVANVMGLVKKFGKNRFHLVVSTAGGGLYSPLTEKAFFQLVSVVKPGGIGMVDVRKPGSELVQPRVDMIAQLARRFNVSIKQWNAYSIVFTKNFGRGKRK